MHLSPVTPVLRKVLKMTHLISLMPKALKLRHRHFPVQRPITKRKGIIHDPILRSNWVSVFVLFFIHLLIGM